MELCWKLCGHVGEMREIVGDMCENVGGNILGNIWGTFWTILGDILGDIWETFGSKKTRRKAVTLFCAEGEKVPHLSTRIASARNL